MKSPYAYIAIEGNIGAGKTTFANWLARHLNCDLIEEQFQENPFLEKFYDDSERYALSVELTFVSDRYRQLRERLGSRNLFRQVLVADYAFVKSMIFAKANLPAEEFKLFRPRWHNQKLWSFWIRSPKRFGTKLKNEAAPMSKTCPRITSTKSRIITSNITATREALGFFGLTRPTWILFQTPRMQNDWQRLYWSLESRVFIQ